MDPSGTVEPLKISGELTPDPDLCHFHLNRVLSESWTLVFNRREDGKGSPLTEQLFAIPGIRRVLVRGSTVTLAKDVETPWPQLAADIAQALRTACGGSGAAIAAEVIADLEQSPMDGVAEAIQQLFEDQINPALASHGGFVHLVKVEGHDVFVEMGGGCQGCASSKSTMRYGVENAIRRIAPQVRQVVDVTDHASGENPYFK